MTAGLFIAAMRSGNGIEMEIGCRYTMYGGSWRKEEMEYVEGGRCATSG